MLRLVGCLRRSHPCRDQYTENDEGVKKRANRHCITSEEAATVEPRSLARQAMRIQGRSESQVERQFLLTFNPGLADTSMDKWSIPMEYRIHGVSPCGGAVVQIGMVNFQLTSLIVTADSAAFGFPSCHAFAAAQGGRGTDEPAQSHSSDRLPPDAPSSWFHDPLQSESGRR